MSNMSRTWDIGDPEPVRVWFDECMIWEYINDKKIRNQENTK